MTRLFALANRAALHRWGWPLLAAIVAGCRALTYLRPQRRTLT